MNEVSFDLEKTTVFQPASVYYSGKRVLTIGASRKILRHFTNELIGHGFAASSSSAYKNPKQIFQNFHGKQFDVVALGRGIGARVKKIIKVRFKKKSRHSVC